MTVTDGTRTYEGKSISETSAINMEDDGKIEYITEIQVGMAYHAIYESVRKPGRYFITTSYIS